jgi:hypothetical protein
MQVLDRLASRFANVNPDVKSVGRVTAGNFIAGALDTDKDSGLLGFRCIKPAHEVPIRDH